MPRISIWVRAALALTAANLFVVSPGRAEYSYFSDVPSGSDIVMKEVRWPYWNNTYYNTWWSDYWTSHEGTSGYFYNGLALPAANSPNPVGTRQTVNFSFWPLSNPVNLTDTIASVYTSPSTFAMATIGEGTLFRSPGLWSFWQTNVWYRMVIRTWPPADGTPHRGYAGTWLRDPAVGVWRHLATVQLPFAVTGIDGSMSFQENASGGSSPQRTDYRRSYYHRNGTWTSSTNWYVYDHGGAIENAGLIESNTAVYYETCQSNGVYTGTITPAHPTSPTYHLTQPATPVFDTILVTNCQALVYGGQLLVQWQTLPASSPQFAYQINVYTNANYTGTPVVTSFAIAPEAQQQLLVLTNAPTPYVQLTLIDIFNQTNAPIDLTPANATVNAATAVSGTVPGLDYAYFESTTDYTSDDATNWADLPTFPALTPVATGATSGLDLTPRRRRNGYAFEYTGYLAVPTTGLYAFTLNSCDGSRLYVDGQLVVDGDGDHSAADRAGWAGLAAGSHTLDVQYFFDVQPTSLFNDYFDTLTLSYQGPGIGNTFVPVSLFSRVPAAGEPSITLVAPTNGAVLSGANVALDAAVTANGNVPDRVQFYLGNNFWGQTNAAPYAQTALFWASPTNAVRARITYNGTNSIDSSVNLVATTNMTLSPWQLTQAFYHNQPNGGKIEDGTYSLIGDGMNLLVRPASGDCTLIAHLAGITTSATAPDGSAANGGWQAGIILRGTTNMTPGYPWGQSGTAPFTALLAQVDGGTYHQDETMVNGGGGYADSVGGQKWFKLQRAGQVFTSSVSTDGTTWTPVFTNMLSDFGTNFYAGFFTYAGPSANPNVHWASFDQVSLVGNLSGPPGVSVTPSSRSVYAGQTVLLTALPTGNAPFSYQWQVNGNNLAAGTNATLTLTNVPPSAAGLYTVTLTNANGAATATAALTVLLPSAPVAAVLANQPAGYWRLNEVSGPTAYDTLGQLNGAAEGNAVFGVPGVDAAPFVGFEAGHLAAQFDGSTADIEVPSLGVTTTNFTITGWVKCNGPQTSWAGLVFSRGSGHGTGLMLANHGANLELRYSWNDDGNDYNFSTGLDLPTNGGWAFVGLTIEPTRAIVFLATNSVLLTATNIVANSGRTLAGDFYFGYDPNSGTRRLAGALDDLAIYNRTLTPAQMAQLLAAATTAVPVIQGVSWVDGAIQIVANGSAGAACVLLGATNLAPPVAWQPVQTNTVGSSGSLDFSNLSSTDFAQRFYRLLTP